MIISTQRDEWPMLGAALRDSQGITQAEYMLDERHPLLNNHTWQNNRAIPGL